MIIVNDEQTYNDLISVRMAGRDIEQVRKNGLKKWPS